MHYANEIIVLFVINLFRSAENLLPPRDSILQTATRQRQQRTELMLIARQSVMPAAAAAATTTTTTTTPLRTPLLDVEAAAAADGVDAGPAKRFRSVSLDAASESRVGSGSERAEKSSTEVRRWSQPAEGSPAAVAAAAALAGRSGVFAESISSVQRHNKLLAEKLAAPPLVGQ